MNHIVNKIKALRLNEKQRTVLFSLSLFMIPLAAFLLIGTRGYLLCDDSPNYIYYKPHREGVMPTYPFFLQLNRLLFGEDAFLYAVAVEQALFAAGCIWIFVQMLRRRFRLPYWQGYMACVLALVPFTTELPGSMATQWILTEGIAYAAFYLFMAVLLKAVWTKRFRWIAVLFGMTLLLSLTRSQLQMLFGVDGIIFLYIALFRTWGRRKSRITGGLAGLVGCVLISISGVWMTGKIASAQWHMPFTASEQDVSADRGAATEEAGSADRDMAKTDSTLLSGQYLTLIFSKGMYEADYEDHKLFADEKLRQTFLDCYAAVNAERGRYTYATPGLWIWKDIGYTVMGIGRLTDGLADSGARRQIGMALIKAHFGRVLYHSLLLLPAAFVFTVFFQIEEIYLLCHLYTLFVYLSAFALMVWAYKDKKADKAYGEFMAAVLVVNICMVTVISVVFVGLQRYLVYDFGIFYIAYFLLLMQVWKIYGRSIRERLRERRLRD